MDLPQDIIALKRDGYRLGKAQIRHFVDCVVDGRFEDSQSAALLMAIVLKGMDMEETAVLTESMLRSGRIVALPEIDRPKVDKHSTGGVGDKVSLILSPLAAAVGLCVPMMSGRGLGHTGGTLDKLEAIPGFSVELGEATYRAQLKAIHAAMIGQSADMVPADKKLYALRDATATVESIPLISTSILSKKLAEGIDALVLDVKCGSGAFMKTEAEARALAAALVSICGRLGKPASALLTRMEEPLGCAVGNACEVEEAIDCLKGSGPADLREVTLALVAEMLCLGGLCGDARQAWHRAEAALDSGAALEGFARLVEAQGGDAGVIDAPSRLPRAPRSGVYTWDGGEGYLCRVDALKIGEAARLLGAGRARSDGAVDPAAGIRLRAKAGAPVTAGAPLCDVFYRDDAHFAAAVARLREAFECSVHPPSPANVVIDQVDAEGLGNT